MSIIPDGLKDLQHQMIQSLFDSELARTCTVVYPAIKTECPNCNINPFTNTSNGIYNGTGPRPFTNGGICPLCQGRGVLEVTTTEDITVLVYLDKKTLMDMKINVDVEDGVILVEGKDADWEKVYRSDYIILLPEYPEQKQEKYMRNSPRIPKGFGKNAFWSAQFVRAESK
jgi:hypothetical protein